ncbi:LytR/AlgR family response regulator transcription factor [Mucilaginibacter calamicampi]|uniref:LytR/AlgR family response regulator transcription factor n=1 Tax=Mucilaginibacter calamicampi TaxID=1302352 RepID=A0ABW2YS43_9SPHI
MKQTCYIVDDELHAVEMLITYIAQTEGLELAGYSTNPLVALNEVTGDNPPDVTFLDVEMPELSGLDFTELAGSHTRIVLTTAYQEFAVAAFEKEVFDYLLKPISYTRFRKCIQRIERSNKTKAHREKRDFFYVKSDIKGKAVKVRVNDIIYVEGALNYVKIHQAKGAILSYLTLSEMLQYLPAEQFSRIHHSFIINNEKITTIEGGRVTLEGHIYVTLGRSYKETFLAQMSQSLLKSKRQP